MCAPALRHSRENNSIPEIFSEAFSWSIKNICSKGHKIKHIAIRYNELLKSIWSKTTVFFPLKFFFLPALLNTSMRLYFPFTTYWKVLRTNPLKMQHVLRLTHCGTVLCHNSLTIYIKCIVIKAFWQKTLTAVCISSAPGVALTRIRYILSLPPGLKKKTTLERLLGLSETYIVEMRLSIYIVFLRTTATLLSSLYKLSNWNRDYKFSDLVG